MTLLKKTLAAAVASLAFGAAQAGTYYVPMDPGAPGDFDDTWTVGTTQTRGTTSFDDFFVFNVPDTQDLSVSLSGTSATLDGFALYVYPADSADDLLVLDALDTSATSLSWSDIVLTSGTYVLEVAGEYLRSTGSSYTGTILGVEPAVASPVPEPASWALLLLGLGATAGVARRRRN